MEPVLQIASATRDADGLVRVSGTVYTFRPYAGLMYISVVIVDGAMVSQKLLIDPSFPDGGSWQVQLPDSISPGTYQLGVTAHFFPPAETGDGSEQTDAILNLTFHASPTLGDDTFSDANGFADTIDLLAGDDTYSGENGNDTITGGAGRDTLNGNAGDDRFVILASDLVSGEIYDGGSDTDTAALVGGGLFDLTQVTLADIESIAVEGATATTVRVLDFAQAALIDPGTTTTTIDIADITTAPGVDAAERVFRLLENGVDAVTWEAGGVGRTATQVDADTMRIAQADGTRSDITFNTQSGLRIDAIITDVNDVHDYERLEIAYDQAGRMQSRTVFEDDGTETFTEFADGVRTLTTRTDDSAPGDGPAWASITTAYASNGQTTSRTTLLDNGTRIETSYTGGVRSGTTHTDLSSGGTAQSWNTINTTYDTGGTTLTSREIIFDNGVRATQNYSSGVIATQSRFDDSVGGTAVDWSQMQMAYDGAGILESIVVHYDNNSSRSSSYQNGQLIQDYRYDAVTNTSRLTGGNGDNLLDSTGLADIVRGGGGNDTIISYSGNDTLTGGTGDDTFVFRSIGRIDRDTITDFGNGADRLDLQEFGIYALADLLAPGNGHSATQEGADTVIDFGANGTITLRNFMLGSLTDAHFVNDL